MEVGYQFFELWYSNAERKALLCGTVDIKVALLF